MAKKQASNPVIRLSGCWVTVDPQDAGINGIPPVSGYGSMISTVGHVCSGAIEITSFRSKEQFDLEMRACHAERAFLNALWKDIRDVAARNAYADWLEEQGRYKGSRMIRDGFTPGL